MLKKSILSIFFIILVVLPAFSQENVQADNTQIQPEEQKLESNNTIDNSSFEVTKVINATAEIEHINGIRVITVRQNNDLQYNIGYSIGRALIKDDTEYPVRLRNFLDTFNKNESVYQVDIVVKILSKSVPCWFKQQLQGLADSLSINKQKIEFSFEDVLTLNTVALWKKLPRRRPNQPPPAPTSVVPIKKTDYSVIQLSPDSETRDQESVIISTPTIDDGTVIARSYQRNNFDFFDNYPAVTVYYLDNASFVNVGYAGLLATMSAINSHGISINSIQYYEPKTIEIIGNTPPTEIARTAIETCKTIEDCQSYLVSQVSNFKQSFIVSDGKKTIKIDTNTDNLISKNSVTDITGQNYLLTDFTDSQASQDVLKTINSFRNSVKSYSLQDIKDMFRSFPLLNTASFKTLDTKRSVFNVIFNPTQKETMIIAKDKEGLVLGNQFTVVKYK